jgi:hypothetical protein
MKRLAGYTLLGLIVGLSWARVLRGVDVSYRVGTYLGYSERVGRFYYVQVPGGKWFLRSVEHRDARLGVWEGNPFTGLRPGASVKFRVGRTWKDNEHPRFTVGEIYILNSKGEAVKFVGPFIKELVRDHPKEEE